jgi:hypothetical protein
MLLVRKHGEVSWRSPNVTAYSDEQSLQMLIQRSPNLLNGADSTPMAMASEVTVPGIGSADLVGVDASGGITIVECKLKANPEIRRQVVGQIFAYASGLSKLTYEQFDALFAAKVAPLVQMMIQLGPDEWDAETFRTQVATNLAAGNFRLIIAVDEITDELKGIVQYINQHTTADLKFLALELTYVADDGFEILVPQTYGEETIQSKGSNPTKHRWDEPSVFEALAGCCTPAGVQAVRQLYDYAFHHGATFRWGVGPLASVTARMKLGGKDASVFSIYEWPEGKGSVGINFEYMVGYVPNETLMKLLSPLRTIPGMTSRLTAVEQAGFLKRPSVMVDESLIQPGTCDTLIDAINELLKSSNESN